MSDNCSRNDAPGDFGKLGILESRGDSAFDVRYLRFKMADAPTVRMGPTFAIVAALFHQSVRRKEQGTFDPCGSGGANDDETAHAGRPRGIDGGNEILGLYFSSGGRSVGETKTQNDRALFVC